MSSTIGKNLKLTLGGMSHGPCVTVRIEGIPEGTVIDYRELDDFLLRRSPIGKDKEGATKRREPDEIQWKKGVVNFGGEFGIVSENIIEAEIPNLDADSSAYDELKYIPRPGHADFGAMMKDGIETDLAGGGRFSGRLTVGLCLAGGIVKQLLKKEGIEIMTDVAELGGEEDPMGFEDAIDAAKSRGDSVGGIIECGIMGVKPGSCGDAYFGGLEGKISEAVFGIPAVKGIEFGSGFRGAATMGSQNNDEFYVADDGRVRTYTNNHGGILGGIASGMPIVFRVAIKPVPSISKKQHSVNLKTMEPVEIEIKGRHDACIVFRTLPCVEACAALAIYDALHSKQDDVKHDESDNISDLRAQIDEFDAIIADAIKKRLKAAGKIGEIKASSNMEITDSNREKEVMNKVLAYFPDEMKAGVQKLYEDMFELSKSVQKPKDNRRTFGLLGRKLGHTMSPELHAMICRETGEDYRYEVFEKEPEELEDFIRKGTWEGLNITIPYKTEVIKYIDELSPEAQAIGAVNTIVRRNGKLKGFNTDYFGFKNSLELNGADIEGRKCLVLGNGGASRAVVQVLFDKKASKVHVLSHAAMDEIKKGKSGMISGIRDTEIIVNTTPLGMYPNEKEIPLSVGKFPKLLWAIDVVYNPLRTEFLCQAKRNLIDTIGGLDMLVYQGIYSSMLFTTHSYANKHDIAIRIADSLKKQKENLVLIGMPGVGKTTIGREMAEKLGKEFADTDTLIEIREGKTIPEIFAKDGEEYFRDIEEIVISELSNRTGLVIATGGGIVNREENYYNLAMNGRMIFLNKPKDEISQLPINGRPVSQRDSVERLYEMRFPIYSSWADEILDV